MPIFIIKLIAIFFMLVDHIKYALPSCYNEFTLYFGRIAFPLFAFCIVQGYIHTHDLKKYFKRLLIFGIVSEIPYLLFNSLPLLQRVEVNVMITFLLALIALELYEFVGGSWKGFLCIVTLASCAEFLKTDYGAFGVFLVFSFYVFRDSKWKTLLLGTTVISCKYLHRILFLRVGFTEYSIKNWICTLIPLFIILLYNGKRGPKLKWFFYIFYPLHLLVLYLISPYAVNLLNL